MSAQAKSAAQLPTGPQCADCGAGIFWEVTEGGARIPVDVEPRADGTIEMRRGRAHFVTADELPLVERYGDHRKTCTNKPAPTASDDIATKRAYVAKQGQTRSHECHWTGCGKMVPPALWGCKAHWFALPKGLRDRIWATYRAGQERDGRPSPEYLAAADEVQRWIKVRGAQS